MRIVDIHSHILPGIDDGAKDVETSVKLLKMYKEQGVTDIFATPHFIPMQISLDEFINLREESYNLLKSQLPDIDYDMPRIHLGAEVLYFSGMGKSEGIKKLRLEGTSYILIELPVNVITSGIIDDIREIKLNLGLTPIIAHIERIYGAKNFKKLISLIETGYCLAQVNATSFIKGSAKRITHKLVKKGLVSFIATDTHSVHGRPPRMDSALDIAEVRLKSEIYNRIIANMNMLIKDK